jgi:3'(2'), 5'-bisphosphate nucleotidase
VLAPLAVGEVHAPLRFVRSRSHPDERIRRLEAALGEVEVILSGSAGSKCALVASGAADLYVHPVPYLKEWDTCAPDAKLRAAGGRVTDCEGEALRYGKDHPAQPGGIFAAHPAAWEYALPIVRELANGTASEGKGVESK